MWISGFRIIESFHHARKGEDRVRFLCAFIANIVHSESLSCLGQVMRTNLHIIPLFCFFTLKSNAMIQDYRKIKNAQRYWKPIPNWNCRSTSLLLNNNGVTRFNSMRAMLPNFIAMPPPMAQRTFCVKIFMFSLYRLPENFECA